MEVPDINLKVIVLLHWLLATWATMGLMLSSYAWSNFTMLGLGVWAVAHKGSTDAALMFLLGMSITVLTDSVHIGISYSQAGSSLLQNDMFRFCIGMAILGLLLKPASCFFIFHKYRQRGGQFAAGLLTTSRSQNSGSYQSLDAQSQPSS